MQKNGKMMPCECCGKEVYIPLARQESFRFCSQVCHGKMVLGIPEVQARIKRKIGKNHWRWKKEGCKRKDGYVLISVNGQRYFEHRYVMEKHLGRKLSFDETIHHKDGNKENNKLKNLEIISRSDHTRIYHPKKCYDEISGTAGCCLVV
jgi:hypothetical protein